MTILQDLQKPSVGKVIELYTLDMSPFSGPIIHFSPNTIAGVSQIAFGGISYVPMPITGDGWQTSIDGQPPQPTLKISNVTKYIQTYLTTYKDLVGAKLTRVLTLDKYLDSGSSPDSTQIFSQSVFVIAQKTRQTKLEIEFKMTSVIDIPAAKLPKQQVLRTEFPGAGLYRKP
jgi:lambda family phage minor tail protein L